MSSTEALEEREDVIAGYEAASFQEPRAISNALLPLSTYLNILHGAVWGVLARKGLMALTLYNGSFLGGVIWANFAACVVMGMAVASSRMWEPLLNIHGAKGSVPLYAGISTGFCGTCSSFSSFILEAFEKAANVEPTAQNYPNAAYGIMEALAVIIAHLGISAAGFRLGQHLMGGLDSLVPALHPKAYKFVDTASCAIGVAAYIAAIVLIPTERHSVWRSWTFLVLFAPWGAFVRFALSKYLNTRLKGFPAGTFAANVGGCLLLCIFTLLQRGRYGKADSRTIVSHILPCHVLQGLDDGFCGALTTVSTFVVEMFTLPTMQSYRYALLSVVASFCLFVLILGSYNWAVGLLPAVCH